MKLTDKHPTFYKQKLLKTFRASKHFGRLEFYFDIDRSSCIATVLKERVKRTDLNRKCNSHLLLSYSKLFNPLSFGTIARWLKIVLNNAGIVNKQYGVHSTHATFTSTASYTSVKTTMDVAGWQTRWDVLHVL